MLLLLLGDAGLDLANTIGPLTPLSENRLCHQFPLEIGLCQAPSVLLCRIAIRGHQLPVTSRSEQTSSGVDPLSSP